jgi:hypothetical protein
MTLRGFLADLTILFDGVLGWLGLGDIAARVASAVFGRCPSALAFGRRFWA